MEIGLTEAQWLLMTGGIPTLGLVWGAWMLLRRRHQSLAQMPLHAPQPPASTSPATTLSKDSHGTQTMTDATAEQKQAIARLVTKGKMAHEAPGQFPEDFTDEASRNAIPPYDLDAIREAMPDILQIDFDENEKDGCWTTLHDGKSDEWTKVMLGRDLPKTTKELIKIVQAHYREQFKLDDMDETADAFAAFDDIE